MAKRHLTAAFVANAKPAPGAAQTDHFDSALPGFGLRVGKQRKSWFVITRVLREGAWKQVRITLGTNAELSLADARQAAREALEQAQQGKDPSGARKQRREVLEARSRDTFASVRADFLKRYIGREQRRPAPRTLREMERALSCDVLSAWDDQPLADIGERDIIAALDELTERGASIMANRTLAYLRLLFKWAKSRRIIDSNPAADIDKPGAERSRDRVLGMDELFAIWRATDDDNLFSGIVRALLLTGQRRDEVAGMRWDELDGALWTLPATRTKNNRPHVVPLAAPVLEIIEARRAALTVTGRTGPFIFSSNDQTPFSGFSKSKARLDARVNLAAPWTLHDLRRSAATHMADALRIPPHIIETVLNHISGTRGGIVGVYNRAQHLDERRAALDAWADFVLREVAR